MKCPHCGEEIPGSACPHCESTNPDDAAYCMTCGAFLGKAETDGLPGADESDDEFDLENRELCPDGLCTGIIVGGRCTECGRTPEEAAAADSPADVEPAA